MAEDNAALVGIVMGSESDVPVMQGTVDTLKAFGIPFEIRVMSAHRTPHMTQTWAESAHERGMKVIIAGAGGAAHLAGVVAAHTPLPVLGVPVPSRHLNGLDSLLATVQMPSGVPVGTLAIGGAKNAALLAVQILATSDDTLREQMIQYKKDMIGRVEGMDARVQAHFS